MSSTPEIKEELVFDRPKVLADVPSHYCPGCQTGGKLLADRRLSKLLK